MTLLVVLVLGISWISALGLPLGDDHQGRALGRMVLQADNFIDEGWVGSGYISEWDPYSTAPYAHHPPLTQFIHAAVGWIQGAASALGARFVGYMAGLLSIALLGWFVKRLSRSWLAAALATAGLAASGFFWFFGRSLNLILILAFFLAHYSAKTHPSRTRPYILSGFALVGTLQSWENGLVIGIIAVYDFFRADRKLAISVALGVAGGFALDMWWIESAAGISALRNHLEARVAAADYGVREWILRQGGFYLRFESVPMFLLTIMALVMGLRDRRFRPYVLASFVTVLVFAIVFYQNAWIHEYWNWRISLVLAAGLGAVGASLARRNLRPREHIVGLFLVAAMASIPALRLGSNLYAIQYTESSKAGALVERNDFPPDQEVAWHYGGFSAPRWYSWYTDLPTRPVDVDRPPPSDSLILVKRSTGGDLSGVDAVDSFGHYVLVKSQDLIEAVGDDDGS